MFRFLQVQYQLKGEEYIPTLRKMVIKGRITAEQFKEITGIEYVEWKWEKMVNWKNLLSDRGNDKEIRWLQGSRNSWTHTKIRRG